MRSGSSPPGSAARRRTCRAPSRHCAASASRPSGASLCCVMFPRCGRLPACRQRKQRPADRSGIRATATTTGSVKLFLVDRGGFTQAGGSMLWCLGMYASGSTWVFNAAMKICAAVSPEVPVVGCYVTTLADLDLTEQQQRLGIVKTHNADDEATNALQRLADAILISVRDPRDCVTSLMLYQRY